MGVTAVFALLQVIVANLPGAITTGQQLFDLGKKLYASINDGREPTAEEVADLRAKIAADETLALEPLPPAQPGDPDYTPPTA